MALENKIQVVESAIFPSMKTFRENLNINFNTGMCNSYRDLR